MTHGGALEEIGIVLYPGVQMAAVHGLTDLFHIANRLSVVEGQDDGSQRLRVTHWSLGEVGEKNLSCVYSSDRGSNFRPRSLILPPTLLDLPDPATCACIGRWLQDQHAQGVMLVSICSGVFLLAGTGLLEGRAVSTHRNCAQALKVGFPGIQPDIERRIIDHIDIITAGGFMAWVDIGLILVERLLGEAVRNETARFILSDPAAGEAQYFAGFVPRQTHSDIAVRRAQDLIHARDGQGLSLAAIGSAAKLDRRTLLRRFMSATGLTPMDYCRAVRIARARELLESGKMPLKEIAGNLGYGDSSSFARAFRRTEGVPPGAYRKRHSGDSVANP